MKKPFEAFIKGLTSVARHTASFFTTGNIMRLFTNNLLSKLVAVGFALIIWIYVIGGTNPSTDRTFYNVPVRLEGEAALNTKLLALTQDADSYIKTVQVRVNAKLRDVLSLTDESIIARLDFSKIERTGEQKVEITARLPGLVGEVLEITPNTVDVVVDTLVTKQVPMNVKTSGQLKNGLWNDVPQAAIHEIVVKGPASQVEEVAYAQVTINLDNVSGDVQSSRPFSLYNENDEKLEYSEITTGYEGVKVNMKVYPTKDLPVEADMVGQLPEGLVVGEGQVSINPGTVRVVAAQEDLDAVTSVKVQVQLSRITEEYVELIPISASPSWIKVIPDSVEVRVNVQEEQVEHTFTVPVNIEGESGAYLYNAEPSAVDVVVTGILSKVRELTADNFTVVADVTGLGAGRHEVTAKIINPPLGFEPIIREDTVIVEVTPIEE